MWSHLNLLIRILKKVLLFIISFILLILFLNYVGSFIHIVEMLLMLYNHPHLLELFTAQKKKYIGTSIFIKSRTRIKHDLEGGVPVLVSYVYDINCMFHVCYFVYTGHTDIRRCHWLGSVFCEVEIHFLCNNSIYR